MLMIFSRLEVGEPHLAASFDFTAYAASSRTRTAACREKLEVGNSLSCLTRVPLETLQTQGACLQTCASWSSLGGRGLCLQFSPKGRGTASLTESAVAECHRKKSKLPCRRKNVLSCCHKNIAWWSKRRADLPSNTVGFQCTIRQLALGAQLPLRDVLFRVSGNVCKSTRHAIRVVLFSLTRQRAHFMQAVSYLPLDAFGREQ